MALYAVTDFVIEDGDINVVTAALEAKVETVDTTKTIRLFTIVFNTQSGKFVGTLIYDA